MHLSFVIYGKSQILPTIKRVLKEESVKIGFSYCIVTDSASYKDCLTNSKVIIIHSYNLPDEIEKVIHHSKSEIVISTTENYVHLSRGKKDILEKAVKYFKFGGEENLRNLVRFLLKSIGFDVEFEEVKRIHLHGIFHPKLGFFETTEDYLKAYELTDKLLIGILFNRSDWLYGNTELVDKIIKAVESEGLGVLPVFTYGWRDELLSSPSKEDTIREFFLIRGKPIVSAVINLTSFFLLDHGKWHKKEKFKAVNGVDLLRTLNVPIIQPCYSYYQSVSEWLENPQGLDYLSQVWTVIMPEVDGLIEPIYIAGSVVDNEGVKRFKPYEEHLRYLAKRVKKWIEIRNKNPEERKIAIVLINPPCKSLEASVAVGAGLDVPESVARLLNKLKELGYKVENPPKNGKELIKLILERKAISEFRWTSVEEIVAKGGAVDFVDLDTYMEWFNELPEEIRDEMIKEWGHPKDVLEGKFSKEFAGMVYNGRFVIPGLLFGNVFVTPQPKFGCAGARCDGRVCKILHNPKIPPPHQWLAVYRWINRVFKADVIIHFGTHGALEFRPGKGVGLSTRCYPEISIDDVPHVYIYNVSNPMEGVIAKRRSYAVIVDHIYPPMAMAEVLDEVDSLLAQYSKAKSLGDFERAEVIYNGLVEKAKDNNIPIKGKSPDEVVENIHRYVDSVKNTQIEMGLHIFGNPRLDKLAEWVATVMANDTHEYPSIRRVIAEYLGLDYDEIRTKPNKINKFGITNSEILRILHKIAVKTIDELLKCDNVDDTKIISILDKNISEFLGGAVNA